MMAIANELLLGTPNELKKYLNTLPTSSELRFPSITSDNGKFAANIVVYDEKKQAVLLGVYKTNLSGLPKDKVETDGSIIDKTETIFSLVRFGILRETGLDALQIKMLDPQPMLVKNTDPRVDAEFHERYHALVDKFKGNVKPYDELLSPKYGPFVWVKVSLLGMIFDRPIQILSLNHRPHAQREAYVRFMKYIAPRESKTIRKPFKYRLRDNLKKGFFKKSKK